MGSEAYLFDHYPVECPDEATLVSGFLQSLSDWGVIWNDLGPSEKTQAAFSLEEELRALEEVGFAVYARRVPATDRERARDALDGGRLLRQAPIKPSRWPYAGWRRGLCHHYTRPDPTGVCRMITLRPPSGLARLAPPAGTGHFLAVPNGFTPRMASTNTPQITFGTSTDTECGQN